MHLLWTMTLYSTINLHSNFLSNFAEKLREKYRLGWNIYHFPLVEVMQSNCLPIELDGLPELEQNKWYSDIGDCYSSHQERENVVEIRQLSARLEQRPNMPSNLAKHNISCHGPWVRHNIHTPTTEDKITTPHNRS